VETDTLAARIRAAAAPLVDAASLDLVDVVVRGQGPRRVVRVVVDRKGGVDIDTCARLSRELEPRLDALNELGAGYVLEVTSPGVDAPLRDRRAFDRVEGRAVLVHRRDDDGRLEQVRGTVLAAEAEAVLLDVGGEPVRVPYDRVAKATQSLPW
jgi:ribosome maturation factor RimP